MIINPIDKLINELLLNPASFSISDLGGIDYLHCNVDAVYSSRFLPEILNSIIDEFEQSNELEKEKHKNILLNSIRFCNDAFTIQEVIQIVEKKVYSIFDAKDSFFLIYLEESKNKEKNSVVRSWLIEAAFRSALIDKSKRFKLISSLLDISVDDCNEFLRHVSKILGLLYSSWQEEELIFKLKEIKNFNKGLDEVWFELGMCYLLNALNSETNEEVLSYFSRAKDHFQKSIELNSERPDAVAYEACIAILLASNNSEIEIDRDEKLRKISKAITIYNAWHASESDSIWLTARNTELVNWYILIDKLKKLITHLAEPTWFEPKHVIETYLLNTYTASRTILKRKQLGGLEKIIQPKIINSLNKKPNQLFLLDKWISLQLDSELGEIGKKIKQEIYSSKDKIFSSKSDLTPSTTKLSSKKISEFEKFVKDYKNDRINNIPIHIEQIFNDIIPILSDISDFNKDNIQRVFKILLFHSLQFLKLRMDGSKKNHKEFSYLFEQKIKPLETELQKDYYQFMYTVLFDGNTSVEKSDIASGRVDVYFSFGKFNISAEIKRDWDDCSFESLKTKYLGQASEYSNTDAKLGFLLVLDLTPKPNGVKSIESSVKVEIIEKENDPVKRAIVVIVVPGMRKTPSNIKIRE